MSNKKLTIILLATLLGTFYLGHQANNIEWPKPPPPVPSITDMVENDCWDEPSCAATREGYIVTDPRGTSDPVLVTDLEAADPRNDAYAEGDDNADGRIDEDESGWNCATMGNKTCG